VIDVAKTQDILIILILRAADRDRVDQIIIKTDPEATTIIKTDPEATTIIKTDPEATTIIKIDPEATTIIKIETIIIQALTLWIRIKMIMLRIMVIKRVAAEVMPEKQRKR